MKERAEIYLGTAGEWGKLPYELCGLVLVSHNMSGKVETIILNE
jgi:hypothetical protein